MDVIKRRFTDAFKDNVHLLILALYKKKMNKVRKVIEYMIVDFCVTKIKLGWIRINISALEIKLTLL